MYHCLLVCLFCKIGDIENEINKPGERIKEETEQRRRGRKKEMGEYGRQWEWQKATALGYR